MDYAVLLLILGSVAAGVTAAVVTTWRLRARLYSLEDLTTRLEGHVLRETKARAAAERWKKPDADAALLSQLQAPAPTKKYNFWQRDLPRSVPVAKG